MSQVEFEFYGSKSNIQVQSSSSLSSNLKIQYFLVETSFPEFWSKHKSKYGHFQVKLEKALNCELFRVLINLYLDILKNSSFKLDFFEFQVESSFGFKLESKILIIFRVFSSFKLLSWVMHLLSVIVPLEKSYKYNRRVKSPRSWKKCSRSWTVSL